MVIPVHAVHIHLWPRYTQAGSHEVVAVMVFGPNLIGPTFTGPTPGNRRLTGVGRPRRSPREGAFANPGLDPDEREC